MLRNLMAAVLALSAMDAQALSGEEITRYCDGDACGGYFVGVFDAARIIGAIGTDKQRKAAMICPPDAVGDEEVVDVALAYLQRHPEALHLQAANLTLRAWRERWPCR